MLGRRGPACRFAARAPLHAMLDVTQLLFQRLQDAVGHVPCFLILVLLQRSAEIRALPVMRSGKPFQRGKLKSPKGGQLVQPAVMGCIGRTQSCDVGWGKPCSLAGRLWPGLVTLFLCGHSSCSARLANDRCDLPETKKAARVFLTAFMSPG